jgi:double-strand break repair protein MRE11
LDVPRLIEHRHVESTLRALMKGVQASGEVPEDSLDDVVSKPLRKSCSVAHPKHSKLERVREERERQYAAEQRSGKTGGVKVCDSVLSDVLTIWLILLTKGKGKGRAEVDDDDAGSVDSMAMEIDEPGSDFGSDTGRPPSGKKSGTGRGKKATVSTGIRKKAPSLGRKGVVS